MNHLKSPRLKTVALALLGALSFGAVGLAHADVTLTRDYTLAELVGDQALTIQVGDKLFSHFDWHANGFYNDATGGLWNSLDLAAHINVHGEQVNNGNYGLDFTGPLQAHPGDSASAQLTYTVSVVNPHADGRNWYLSDFHLDGDVLVSGGNGQAVVRQSVSDQQHTLIPLNPAGPLEVSQYAPGVAVYNDEAFTQAGLFPTQAEIETTILLSASIPGTNASVIHFQQQFSQAPAVPEPSTWAMVLTGLAAIGFLQRRRSA